MDTIMQCLNSKVKTLPRNGYCIVVSKFKYKNGHVGCVSGGKTKPRNGHGIVVSDSCGLIPK